MPENAHIGFLTTSFPRFEGDAAGSFVFGMARALARRGHRIEVVAPEPPSPADWRGNPAWLSGVRVRSVSYARPARLQTLFYGAGVPDNVARHPLHGLLSVPAAAALGAAVRRRATMWQAVVSHWLVPSGLVAGMVRGTGIPHLAIAHSGDVHLLKKLPMRRFVLSRLLRGADHLGFVSETLREEFLGMLDGPLRKIGSQRSSVTPMGIEINDFENGKSRETLRSELGMNGVVVLFLGRLVPIKGVDLLIEAVQGLDGVTLWVAGDGPERTRLQRKAQPLGEKVRFLGLVGPAKRAELLTAADGVALPSRVMQGGRHEGMPLTLIEALAAGCPVVATRTGGMAELVNDPKIGRLVEPDDVIGLRDALAELHQNGMLLSGSAEMRKAAVADRDWDHLASFYEDLLLGAG